KESTPRAALNKFLEAKFHGAIRRGHACSVRSLRAWPRTGFSISIMAFLTWSSTLFLRTRLASAKLAQTPARRLCRGPAPMSLRLAIPRRVGLARGMRPPKLWPSFVNDVEGCSVGRRKRWNTAEDTTSKRAAVAAQAESRRNQ